MQCVSFYKPQSLKGTLKKDGNIPTPEHRAYLSLLHKDQFLVTFPDRGTGEAVCVPSPRSPHSPGAGRQLRQLLEPPLHGGKEGPLTDEQRPQE